jgi:hypothetical protein
MASPQAVNQNRQVALALGRVIIPVDKADCHTHAEGVKYLYSDALRLFRTVRLSTDGNSCIATDEFNPAESTADALACLEEWCEEYSLAKGQNSYTCSTPGFFASAETLPLAICQAILAAQGDAT